MHIPQVATILFLKCTSIAYVHGDVLDVYGKMIIKLRVPRT